jgi:hypothetical protein
MSRRLSAAMGVAALLATTAAILPGVASADSAPSPPAAGYPAASGVQTVVLRPINTLSPNAGRVIVCHPDLRQYVHYSKPGKDVSWHWTWTCDSTVHANATSSTYYANFPVATRSESETSASDNFNVRYNGCLTGYWYGVTSYTFSWPGYTPASGEGTSPTNHIKCP